MWRPSIGLSHRLGDGLHAGLSWSRVQFPSGSARVVQWPAVREKFRRLVGGAGVGEEQVARILDRIEKFERFTTPYELTDLLRAPAGK